MRKNIPNIITLLNLASGSVAVYLVLQGESELALYFFLAAIIFDFADGFTARLLHVISPLGKQLDSLADMVSFGLLPATMIFTLLESAFSPGGNGDVLLFREKAMMFSVVIVPVLAALRLARFNLLEESDYFTGLPTPAFALFWTGIYYDYHVHGGIFGHPASGWFIWAVMIVISLLMVIPLPMISLKFKNFRFLPNFIRYLFLLISAIILLLTGIPGLPLVVLTYILLSLVRILLT
ncbi:MAG: CDP-alcohol phosphatidyltransferase family protein [Bacteroidales bacterium]